MGLSVLLALLAIGLLAPEHFPPWLAFQNELPAFAGLGLGIVVHLWACRGRWILPRGALVLGVLILTAVLQHAFSEMVYRGDLALVFTYLGAATIAYAWGYNLKPIARPQDVAQPKEAGVLDDAQSKLSWAFVIVAMISSGMAWMQWFGVEDHWFPWVMAADHSNRALGNLAQPNQLSTLLLIGVVATGVLFERSRLGSEVSVTLLVLITSAVVLTESRTAYVSAAAIVAWYGWQRRAFKRIKLRHMILWILLLFAMSVMHHSLKISPNLSDKVPLRAEMGKVGGRPLMWRQLGEAIQERPWQGYGWLQTPAAQQAGALTMPGTEQTNYAHNQLLDLAIWIGVPGAISFALIFGIGAIWVAQKRSDTDATAFGVAILIPLGVHALLEFPLAYAYFLIPAGLIAGMLERLTTKSNKLPRVTIPFNGLVTSVAVYIVIAGLVAVDYINIEEDFRVARFENRLIQNKSFVYERPSIVFLDQYDDLLAAMRIRAEPNMSIQHIKTLERAANRFSWAALHFRYTLALALNGKTSEAKYQLRLIKGLFGSAIYDEAMHNLEEIRDSKYPQLNALFSP